MFIGDFTEPVTSAGTAAAGWTGAGGATGVGAIKFALGIGATSGSAAD